MIHKFVKARYACEPDNFLFDFVELVGKAVCRMNIKFCKPTGQILGKTVTTGLPSLARQGLSSVATILLNTAAIKYGDAAVAAIPYLIHMFRKLDRLNKTNN